MERPRTKNRCSNQTRHGRVFISHATQRQSFLEKNNNRIKTLSDYHERETQNEALKLCRGFSEASHLPLDGRRGNRGNRAGGRESSRKSLQARQWARKSPQATESDAKKERKKERRNACTKPYREAMTLPTKGKRKEGEAADQQTYKKGNEKAEYREQRSTVR